MTTLQAIGFTVLGGSIVFFLSLLAFALALRRQSVYVAPRCAARPRNVIFNKDKTHPSQFRGSALLGWVKWSLGLTYDDMLTGIPGTGTRKGGVEGSMLSANMDGIVLLRFHAVCYKITVVATVLCLAFILPMNLTAGCYKQQQQGGSVYPGCPNSTSYNLTNYDRTTLANIPALEDASISWGIDFGSLLGRMYGIAFITWIITIYTCYMLRREWIELLAMRRVYYLEDDVWNRRKKELEDTLLRDDDLDEESPSPRNQIAQTSNGKRKKKKTDPMKRRDPWIPHPEQRDTVPNVSLYSVLVGNLPSLPQQAIMNQEDVEAAVGYSQGMSIDWQLALTTTFFDQCVPNQPGFSSSVAAVTILPSAGKMGRAWAKWYAAAAKLRRLRYIRSLIADLRYYDIDIEADSADDDDQPLSSERGSGRSDKTRSIYRDSVRNQKYFREVLGSTNDEEVEANFLLSFNFGPEQFAVYSREFAQSAAACCPNGCGERRLRRNRIDELLIMEQEAIAEVQAANAALAEAQNKIGVSRNELRSTSPPTSNAGSPTQTEIKNLNLGESYDTEAVLIARMHSDGSIPSGTGFASKESVQGTRRDVSDGSSTGINTFNIDHGSASSRIRNRHHRSNGRPDPVRVSEQWSLVESIVDETIKKDVVIRSVTRPPLTGQWTMPKSLDLLEWIKFKFQLWRDSAAHNTTKVVDALARDSTYAIVTFTSRQAAVAARHCLADGRGVGRWTSADDIPVPPLADAAPFQICPCRGCCRPVTISVNDRQKAVRRYFANTLLAGIYIFYTIPLAFATSLIDPSKWEGVFPGIADSARNSAFYNKYLSGLLPALLWTLFFALCPLMFKYIANFGSNASSVVGAEYSALQYYWWFMVVSAFSGNSLATMVINGFSAGNLNFEVQEVLVQIASAIPTQISAQWINWIIVRIGVTLPLHYMLQFNTFLFSCFGWKCCSRLVRGGGPGGPVPYRVYVDSGVVLLCVVALAPASPLIAPFALIHYVYCEPVLRRNLIFVYRPKFDGGGIRWPFLFDVIISSLLVGHILMVVMLALKKALGPAIIAAIPFIPTILFREGVRNEFLRSYLDAALLQTSMLDGWDVQQPTSMKKREDFRKFLVDSHKAAYIPVCIAGRDDVMTAEPAAVISHDNDEGHPSLFEPRDRPRAASASSLGSSQFGVAMRRVTPKTLERSRETRNLSLNDDGSRYFSFSAVDNINEEHVGDGDHDDHKS